MLLSPDGSFIRDIDIEELKLFLGNQNHQTVVLTKQKLIYLDHFDLREYPLSLEQFNGLSDQLHNAGLLDLLQPKNYSKDHPTGAPFALTCIFDDGAQYEYFSDGAPSEIFQKIIQIIWSFFGQQ